MAFALWTPTLVARLLFYLSFAGLILKNIYEYLAFSKMGTERKKDSISLLFL